MAKQRGVASVHDGRVSIILITVGGFHTLLKPQPFRKGITILGFDRPV